MNKKVYELMDWPRIEAIVYSEEPMPYDILGPHVIKQGVLIQAFIPKAARVVVKDLQGNKEYPMELADEEGFYSVLLPRKRKIPNYVFVIEGEDGVLYEQKDSYCFKLPFSEEDFDEFGAGIDYKIYQKLGAHLTEIDGTKGTVFSVWAPNAIRVSVIGDFNHWDGRIHQMQQLGNSGVFELFIPGVEERNYYKFEIKKQGSMISIKTDPYGVKTEKEATIASVVASLETYSWNDQKWLETRKMQDLSEAPMSILEIHFDSWFGLKDEYEKFNYKIIGEEIAEYAKEMGYSHILCHPIMESADNSIDGDEIINYYAPSGKYGTPEEFKAFVEILHSHGIGLILDWVPAYFSVEHYGLGEFDGTCLYEHQDIRRKIHGENGNFLFQYAPPQVRNFLLANALFWIEHYHIDGLRVRSVASMLYLDYSKSEGQWVPNIYGGNENLDAVEFIKLLNETIKKRNDGIFMIAEDSSLWPGVTVSIESQGLGFDFKQNIGWSRDFLDYMSCEPFYRSEIYGQLTLSMVYAYCEKFLLCLPGNLSFMERLPGDEERKLANLKLALGFMMIHPGRKILTKGKESQELKTYVKDLLSLYQKEPALYQFDDSTDGFEWINNIAARESMVVFLRKTKEEKDALLVVCNFSASVYAKYKIGVPTEGYYQEIFNSDEEKYGGVGIANPGKIKTITEEWDGRERSVSIKVPPLGILIFKQICTTF